MDLIIEISSYVSKTEMNSNRIVDIHSKHVTLEALQEQLGVNPWRLEEWKAGKTPLLFSVEFGNIAVCEFLLSLGANIEATNEVLNFFLFSAKI